MNKNFIDDSGLDQNANRSIHEPPASIRFAPIKYALAATEEPFKFSTADPVAYELS